MIVVHRHASHVLGEIEHPPVPDLALEELDGVNANAIFQEKLEKRLEENISRETFMLREKVVRSLPSNNIPGGHSVRSLGQWAPRWPSGPTTCPPGRGPARLVGIPPRGHSLWSGCFRLLGRRALRTDPLDLVRISQPFSSQEVGGYLGAITYEI